MMAIHTTSIESTLESLLEQNEELYEHRTESSRGAGEIMTGRNGETELPLGEIRDRLVHGWDFIFDINLEKHRDGAITIMDRLNQHNGP